MVKESGRERKREMLELALRLFGVIVLIAKNNVSQTFEKKGYKSESKRRKRSKS